MTLWYLTNYKIGVPLLIELFEKLMEPFGIILIVLLTAAMITIYGSRRSEEN